MDWYWWVVIGVGALALFGLLSGGSSAQGGATSAGSNRGGTISGREVIAALEAPIPDYARRLAQTLRPMQPNAEQACTWFLLGTLNSAFSASRLPTREQGAAGQFLMAHIRRRDSEDVRRIVGDISGRFIVHPLPVVVRQFAGQSGDAEFRAAEAIVRDFISQSVRCIDDFEARHRIAWG